jgi:hypothetical protein
MLGLLIGWVTLSDLPAPWARKPSPLGIASLEVPNRCTTAPGAERPGTRMLAMDCWLNHEFEIAVIDVQIDSPTADLGTVGVSFVRAALGSTVTEPVPVTTPAGQAYDVYGTGHLEGHPIRFKARIFDIAGSMVIVAGSGPADADPRDADYERAIHSVQPIAQ